MEGGMGGGAKGGGEGVRGGREGEGKDLAADRVA